MSHTATHSREVATKILTHVQGKGPRSSPLEPLSKELFPLTQRSAAFPSSGPSASYNIPVNAPLFDAGGRSDPAFSSSPVYIAQPVSGNYTVKHGPSSRGWDAQGGYSPTDSVDDIIASPSISDYGLDNGAGSSSTAKGKNTGKGRPQRRPSNRDEFDGPHQFLQRPPPGYIALQERDLPHLPTNLLVQEQDSVLNQVNDRLSQCAYDFVAKYQFPIPLTQDMRPVERPQDREWTEWVYLLKRLATKRRIPVSILTFSVLYRRSHPSLVLPNLSNVP